MSQIVWTQKATDDLNRHYDFIKLNNPEAATPGIGGRMVAPHF